MAGVVALLLALALQSSSVRGTQCGATVLRQDFNSYPNEFKFCTAHLADELFPVGPERRSGDGSYRKSGMLRGGAMGLERLMVGHNMAKINHRAGCVGAKSTANDGRPCGVLLQVRLAKAMESATLTYKVKFSRDYNWTLGGKLPGLCSENCPVGCRTVTHNAGWSNRIMWRRQGHLVSYAYQPDKTSRCGVDYRWGKKAVPGQWHEIRLYMKMNHPGVADGVQKVWFDGELVWEKHDLLYRNRPGHRVEKFIFNNFHGGNANGPKAPEFAPHQDQSVWIDDILIQEGECPGSVTDVPLQAAVPHPYPTSLPPRITDNTLMRQRFATLRGSVLSEERVPTEFRLLGG